MAQGGEAAADALAHHRLGDVQVLGDLRVLAFLDHVRLDGETLVGDEDPAFAGGSYVIVQKYLHDLTSWNRVPVEEQERIVGRTKLSNVELPDDVKPEYAHNALTVVEADGEEVKILRDNMPFGTPSKGEFGTYFIGYSR